MTDHLAHLPEAPHWRGVNHLALVTDDSGVVGVITLADVLRRLFPQGEVTAA